MEFPYKAVLFDWAYTLVDLVNENDREPLKFVYDFLESENINLVSFESFYQTFKLHFYRMIEISRETGLEANFENALNYLLIQNSVSLNGKFDIKDLVKKYYSVIYSRRKVYSDVIPTLDALKEMGVRMGIISNTTNPGYMKEYELSLSGLNPYFEFSIYSSVVPFRKPHSSIFQLAIHRLNYRPEEILYVGDNLHADVEGSQGVGILSAWINRNHKVLPSGIVPNYEISSLTDLLKISK